MKKKPEPTTLIEGVALACVFAATPLILAIIWTEEPEYIWQLLFSDILIFAICVLCSDPEEKKIPEEVKKPAHNPLNQIPLTDNINGRFQCGKCKTKNIAAFEIEENHFKLICNECGFHLECFTAKNT